MHEFELLITPEEAFEASKRYPISICYHACTIAAYYLKNKETRDTILFISSMFEAGRIQGIREERLRRKKGANGNERYRTANNRS